MKSLTLFRHAKTERQSESGRDFDRRLTDRGRNDARRVGGGLAEAGLGFDMILVSPAARAAETAELAGLTARYDERIYDASLATLLDIVRKVDAAADRLLLVGHNPGLELLASELLGQPVGMATGSVVEMEFPVEQWDELRAGAGRLVRRIEPAELD